MYIFCLRDDCINVVEHEPVVNRGGRRCSIRSYHMGNMQFRFVHLISIFNSRFNTNCSLASISTISPSKITILQKLANGLFPGCTQLTSHSFILVFANRQFNWHQVEVTCNCFIVYGLVSFIIAYKRLWHHRFSFSPPINGGVNHRAAQSFFTNDGTHGTFKWATTKILYVMMVDHRQIKIYPDNLY